jgi:hypothetical protein
MEGKKEQLETFPEAKNNAHGALGIHSVVDPDPSDTKLLAGSGSEINLKQN